MLRAPETSIPIRMVSSMEASVLSSESFTEMGSLARQDVEKKKRKKNHSRFACFILPVLSRFRRGRPPFLKLKLHDSGPIFFHIVQHGLGL